MKTFFAVMIILLCTQAYSFNLGSLVPQKLRHRTGDTVLVQCGDILRKASVESVSDNNHIEVNFRNAKDQFLCGRNISTQTQVKKYKRVDGIPTLKGMFSLYDDILVKCSGKFKRAFITDLSFTTSGYISFSFESVIDATFCSTGGHYNFYSLGELVRNGAIKKY